MAEISGSEAVERERTLASRLRIAVVRLNRRLRAQTPDADVSLTPLSALSCLHQCGALSPGELASREGVRPPSMTRVIAALEERGLVARRAHPTDRRQAIVELTAAGRARIEDEVSARERWLDVRLAEMDDEERAVLCRAAEIIDRMSGS